MPAVISLLRASPKKLSKMKKAIYHQVSECLDDVKNPWDLARHVGLVAKDFDALKRIQIERAVGTYLNLFFAKE